MQKFFFDMKDGVPLRDRLGIEFMTSTEAIVHCKELAQTFVTIASPTIKTLRNR